jgi:hypothetical protein
MMIWRPRRLKKADYFRSYRKLPRPSRPDQPPGLPGLARPLRLPEVVAELR